MRAERVDDGGAHAAGGGRAGDDEAVAAEQGQIGGEVRAEKAGGLLLPDHDVLRHRRDWRGNLVAVERWRVRPERRRGTGLARARALPAPAAAVPFVGAALAG